MVYITRQHGGAGCVFCAEAAGELEESLVVHRGELAIALLNKFPYSSGHVLIAPRRHVGDHGALTDDEALEIHRLTGAAIAALTTLYRPDGFNLGWNLGEAAGAGIADHIHQHVVPRWSGDTSFMPALADVKVLPEHLLETRNRLAAALRA